MASANGGQSILDKCMLFSALTREDCFALSARAYRRRYTAGTPIFHVGDPGDALMAILTGTVRISLPTSTGRELILADLPEGEVFGEVALLDGKGRAADATALTNTELLAISRTDTLRVLTRTPDACLRLLALVCDRLRLSDERMSDLASIELGARLAKAMLRRIELQDDGNTGRARPKLSLSQSVLAQMVGGTREGVNRQLKKWQQAGLVDVNEGWIIVRRKQDLAAIAGLL